MSEKLGKEQILTAIAIIILLFTALIDWNIYSWLILVAIVIILFTWYTKKKPTKARTID